MRNELNKNLLKKKFLKSPLPSPKGGRQRKSNYSFSIEYLTLFVKEKIFSRLKLDSSSSHARSADPLPPGPFPPGILGAISVANSVATFRLPPLEMPKHLISPQPSCPPLSSVPPPFRFLPLRPAVSHVSLSLAMRFRNRSAHFDWKANRSAIAETFPPFEPV